MCVHVCAIVLTGVCVVCIYKCTCTVHVIHVHVHCIYNLSLFLNGLFFIAMYILTNIYINIQYVHVHIRMYCIIDLVNSENRSLRKSYFVIEPASASHCSFC